MELPQLTQEQIEQAISSDEYYGNMEASIPGYGFKAIGKLRIEQEVRLNCARAILLHQRNLELEARVKELDAQNKTCYNHTLEEVLKAFSLRLMTGVGLDGDWQAKELSLSSGIVKNMMRTEAQKDGKE